MSRKEKARAARDIRVREVQATAIEPVSALRAEQIREAQEWACANQRKTGINANEFLSRKFILLGRTKG